MNASAAQTTEIAKLWHAFGVPANGSTETEALGPLGCAIDTPDQNGPGSIDYAVQRFQQLGSGEAPWTADGLT